MARLMADLRALKEGLDEGLLSQAEFDAAREQYMGAGCDTPAEGATSYCQDNLHTYKPWSMAASGRKSNMRLVCYM